MPQDIEERTFQFSLDLLGLYKQVGRGDFAFQIVLKQLLRSGTSIGANVTEGRASSSKKDFVNFHYHALKSARETIYWLKLLYSILVSETVKEHCKNLEAEAGEISKILGRIIINTKERK